MGFDSIDGNDGIKNNVSQKTSLCKQSFRGIACEERKQYHKTYLKLNTKKNMNF